MGSRHLGGVVALVKVPLLLKRGFHRPRQCSETWWRSEKCEGGGGRRVVVQRWLVGYASFLFF